ncbi:MAG: aminoacyl-tRNA hydrolase [Patescibacteria group bacterium]
MILIVGLGNPQPQYSNTRHNLGVLVVNLLVRSVSNGQEIKWKNWRSQASITKLKVNEQEVKVALPLSFMNESGKVVAKLINYLKIPTANLWVIHDDLDLPFGNIRVSWQASSAGHRGVESIIENLGVADFWRFRLGIGRPTSDIATDKFVLQPFTNEEKDKLPFFLTKTVNRIKLSLQEGPRLTIHKYND